MDGNSHDGSLRELDTDPEEFSQQSRESSVSVSSTTQSKKKKSKRRSMVGRAREAAEAAEEQEGELEVVSPRKKSKQKKQTMEEEELEEGPGQWDTTVPLRDDESSVSSPKKRKALDQPEGGESTPRSSSILKVSFPSLDFVSRSMFPSD